MTTPHQCMTEELQERATLFALGILNPEESHVFEEHLSAGCPLCQAEVDGVAAAAAGIGELHALPPPPELKGTLMARIRAEQQPSAAGASDAPRQTPGWLAVRSEELPWEDIGFDGIRVRRLFVDAVRGTSTMLVQVSPGATYPPHRHGGTEECLVIEGDLHVGDDLVMYAGDYQRAERDSVHEVQYSVGGAKLLLIVSNDDELL